MRTKKAIAVLLGVLLSYTLAAMVLALLLNAAGTNAPIMQDMMQRHAPEALPGEDYAPMAEMITGYLAGNVDTFQYAQETPEGTALLFHDYEQQHMADCKNLFDLCRTVLLVSAAMMAAIAVILSFLHHGSQAALGCAVGTGVVLLLLIGLAIWAVLDFDGLFILFHNVSFSNSLWMLNPATDLLIRLMPIGFFVGYVAMIGGIWLVLILLTMIVALFLSRHL